MAKIVSFLITKFINSFTVYFLLLILFTSCIGLQIKPGEKIYWDNDVQIENSLNKKDKKKLESQMKAKINPRPVRHTIGMALKIKNYHEDSSFVPKDSVKYGTLRQKPVVYESAFLPRGELIIKNLLDRNGYFNSVITSDTTVDGKLKVDQHFTVKLDSPFQVARLTYQCPNEEIIRIVRDSFPSPYIKIGGFLAPTFSDLEKDRIKKLLTSKGYFKATYMRIRVEVDTIMRKDIDTFSMLDSTSYADTLNVDFDKIALINITFNHDKGSDTLERYYIDTTFITISNFSSKEQSNMVSDTANYIVLTKPQKSIPDDIIRNSIYAEHGDLWNPDAIQNSQRKLNQYNYFQSTENNVIDLQVDSTNRINRYYTLKMTKKKTIGGNINFYKSSLGGGVQINPNFTNKNIFNKAVKFDISPSYSMDVTLPSDTSKFSYGNRNNLIIDQTIGVTTSLATPKLLLPFKLNFKKDYISESSIDLTISNNRRSQAFVFNNYVTSINYLYKPIKNIVYEFKPLFTNITDYKYRSDAFEQQLSNNYFLRQTFSSAFILGEFAGFSTSNLERAKKLSTYLNASLEEAGAILQLLQAIGLFNNSDIPGDRKKYAKYFKVDINSSALYRFNKSEIASRILIGAGFLRGDNKTMPFVKQYVIGGAYELRGFRSRSVGPGHYLDTTVKSSKIYQSADIKLVFNNEYRFNIKNFESIGLEGAIFVDMGNIWTEKYDPSRPGSQFEFKNLYEDIALSAGYGFRLNIANVLLLRTDIGSRLKYPNYYGVNNGWSQNSSNLNAWDFYKSLTAVQFAVGYPF